MVPSLPSSDGQNRWLRPCLGPGKLTHERESLLGPSAAHLRGQDDQASSPPSSGELRVGDHSLLMCCFCDGHACPNITVAAGTTVSSNGRPTWCLLASWAPPKRGNPSATVLSRRESVHGTGRSRSRRKILTPALGQAARWWPKTSSGRPHRQVREDRGRGSHRRRKSNTRKSWAGNRNKSSVGMALNACPAMGPDWEKRAACSVGVKRGVTVEALNCFSTALEAKNCQPWALTVGSVSATVGRRGGALATTNQLGVSKFYGATEVKSGLWRSVQGADEQVSDGCVTFLYHPQAICPAGPVGWDGCPGCTPQLQSTLT